jgi:hypothetical protein
LEKEISRRGALTGLAGAATGLALTGWMWQAGPAQAATADVGAFGPSRGDSLLDTVVFGDELSEASHQLTSSLSDVAVGALGQPARVFNPPATSGYWGGSAAFVVKCAPAGTTYVTIKLWGDDFRVAEGEQRLQLFCEGEQVGYQDQSAVDNLDLMGTEGRAKGRFFFHTLPLTESITRGKHSVSIEIRSMGRIYAYGQNAAQLYRPMVGTSRPVFRIYTHTDPYFVPPAGDVQGPAPIPFTKVSPGPEVLDQVRARVQKDQLAYLSTVVAAKMDGWAFQSLAEGYLWEGSPAFHQPAALDRVCQAIDGRYLAWKLDEKVLTASDQQWQGFGRVGLVLALLWDDLGTRLDELVGGQAAQPTRHTAYVDMLHSSNEYWRQHFPHYSNQAQIGAIGLYQCNRGLRLLGSELAVSEDKARDYLYQSIGIKPYLGPENLDGTPMLPMGRGYYQVTRQGLTRELGYVGGYGEVTDWLVMMYESVTRGVGGQEAPELREQMIKIIKARGPFRYVDVDDAGARVARAETVVGWRNEHFPGEITYTGRTAWDCTPLMAPPVFKDDDLTGWAQEQIADNQFYPTLARLLSTSLPTRVGLSAMRLVQRDWPDFQALPPSASRLPMNWDAPDLVFTDEEDGVIAVKHGQQILYASLYWRSRQGVNDYARVHHLTPTDQRSGTVRLETRFTRTGTFTIPDWTCWDYAINDPAAVGVIPGGGFTPPGPPLHQAAAGERQYLAPIPSDIPDPTLGVHVPGVETMLVGRSEFYRLAYGPFLIGMNTTTNRRFTLETTGHGKATNLKTGRTVTLGDDIQVPPQSTVILYLE